MGPPTYKPSADSKKKREYEAKNAKEEPKKFVHISRKEQPIATEPKILNSFDAVAGGTIETKQQVDKAEEQKYKKINKPIENFQKPLTSESFSGPIETKQKKDKAEHQKYTKIKKSFENLQKYLLPESFSGVSSTSTNDSLHSSNTNSAFSARPSGPLDPEVTLESIGYSKERMKVPARYFRLPEGELSLRIREHFQQRKYSDLIVNIGDTRIDCHLQVLKVYSDYFTEFPTNTKVITLPEDKVESVVFEKVYEWMLADDPKVERATFVPMLAAAYYLRIDDLIAQCWMLLHNEDVIKEEVAFILYLEAREYGLDVLNILLLRLGKFFLTAVATLEFLNFSADEVGTMLSSSNIGVNSEREVFMSAVRWLTYKWPEREQYALDIFKNIRFGFLPPVFIFTISSAPTCWAEEKIVRNEEIANLLSHHITLNLADTIYRNDPVAHKIYIKSHVRTPLVDREWISDPKSKAPLKFSSYEHFTFTIFIKYLEMLRETGQYWRQIKYLREVSRESEQRQSTNQEDDSLQNAEIKEESESIAASLSE